MEQATTFDFKIPRVEANRILNSGFHVKINKGWTATVRCLKDLVSALASGEHEIDLEVFGTITRASSDEEQGSFYGYLIEIIAAYKGFETFNSCKHTFVELTDERETISIKTASGKLITVCVMEGVAQCMDVKVYGKEKFEIMGFDSGTTPVPSTPVTLMTAFLKR